MGGRSFMIQRNRPWNVTHYIVSGKQGLFIIIIKLAFITYVRPLLEFSCQVWVPKYYYLIDKIESDRSRDFLQEEYVVSEKLSYSERLNILGLETLNRRRVIFDLILLQISAWSCRN